MTTPWRHATAYGVRTVRNMLSNVNARNESFVDASRPRLAQPTMPIRNRSQFTDPTVMFITTMIMGWERLFTPSVIRDEVEDILFGCVAVSGSSLMAYCIMPDHVHMIAGHSDGGRGISRFVGGVKSLVSRRLFAERKGIWVPRFDDVVLRSDSVFRTKLEYTHQNPVRAGFVANATEWKWSSARFWLLDEPSLILTKSWEWIDAAHVL